MKKLQQGQRLIKMRNEDNFEILIQFQGKYLKLYMHYPHVCFSEALKVASKLQQKIRGDCNISDKKRLPGKTRSNRRSFGSFYIYREDILLKLKNKKKKISIATLASEINSFYEQMDKYVNFKSSQTGNL